MEIEWKNYDPGEFYDEMISSPGQARTAARVLANYLKSLSDQQLARRQRAADAIDLARDRVFDLAVVSADADDAFATASELRETDPALAVVMLSRRPSVDQAVRAMRSGCVDLAPASVSGEALDELLTRVATLEARGKRGEALDAEAQRRIMGPGRHDAWLERVDRPAQELTERLGETDPSVGLGLLVAAVRETFEEAGVLLASASSDADLAAGLLRPVVIIREHPLLVFGSNAIA